MARRTSKRFVAAEGQISLFAMDDPTIYEEQAEKPAEKEETQQRLALDFGAQLESYVSQTGGDEAGRKDDSEEEAHVSAEEPVQGREGSPLFLHGAERSGGAGQDGRGRRDRGVSQGGGAKLPHEAGGTPGQLHGELRGDTGVAQLTMAQCRYDDYIRKAESAHKMAEEIALNETVLTL